MNNLTHAERATLDIVFARYPDDMTYNEILNMIPSSISHGDLIGDLVPKEPFESYFRGVDLKIEILRIHSLIIDTLIEFNDKRHQRVMATIR